MFILKTNCMKKTFSFICFIFFVLNGLSQRPCSQPEFRQFDFWVGEWEACGVKGAKRNIQKLNRELPFKTQRWQRHQPAVRN